VVYCSTGFLAHPGVSPIDYHRAKIPIFYHGLDSAALRGPDYVEREAKPHGMVQL